MTEKSYQTLLNGIIWLYEKGTIFHGETIEKTFKGNKLNVYIDEIIAPGHEKKWDKVLFPS